MTSTANITMVIDPLAIEIPKGGYKPKFQDQRAKAEALTQSQSLEDRPEAVAAVVTKLAITYAEKAVEVDPGFGMGIAMLGSAHTLLGNYDIRLRYTRQRAR